MLSKRVVSGEGAGGCREAPLGAFPTGIIATFSPCFSPSLISAHHQISYRLSNPAKIPNHPARSVSQWFKPFLLWLDMFQHGTRTLGGVHFLEQSHGEGGHQWNARGGSTLKGIIVTRFGIFHHYI